MCVCVCACFPPCRPLERELETRKNESHEKKTGTAGFNSHAQLGTEKRAHAALAALLLLPRKLVVQVHVYGELSNE